MISIRKTYICGFSSNLDLDAIFYSIIDDLFYEFVKIMSSVCLVYYHAFYTTIVTIKLGKNRNLKVDVKDDKILRESANNGHGLSM